MGGNIALTFALKYPERVEKLVVAASHAVVPVQIRMFIDAVLEVYEQGASARQMFDLICPWLFSEAFLRDPGNAAYLVYDENEPDPQPLHAWKNQYLAQKAYDVTARLGEITAPTLIIAAEHDVLAPPACAEAMHHAIAGSVLHMISGAGHLMNYEQPEVFHDSVVEFLAGRYDE